MSELPIREPKQKRSIQKKTKIIQAGLTLFCEKGFYHTNTVEIAQAAGVSTGTIYSYFKDKKDIYTAAFESFLESHIRPLLAELAQLQKPVDIKIFICKCIDLFIELYVNSKHTIHELGLMQESDPEIMQYFATYEDMILSSFVECLDHPGITKQNLSEKMYLLYTLADVLGQEKAFHYHRSIDLEILREQITDMLVRLFEEAEQTVQA